MPRRKKADAFEQTYPECAGRSPGMARTLCQMSIFAEKNPKLAGVVADIGCSALKTSMRHPKLMRSASRFL